MHTHNIQLQWSAKNTCELLAISTNNLHIHNDMDTFPTNQFGASQGLARIYTQMYELTQTCTSIRNIHMHPHVSSTSPPPTWCLLCRAWTEERSLPQSSVERAWSFSLIQECVSSHIWCSCRRLGEKGDKECTWRGRKEHIYPLSGCSLVVL